MWGVKDIQKELFPYEWFDSLDKLSETSLPPIACFYNKLRNTSPSETEYEHAVRVWKEKRFASFGEYMMYYCRCDVELLLQGTTNYRTLLMTKSNMELLNYVSVAQISYQNILKNYLKHDLRTIPSQKMYNLISDSIYGGRCEVFKRHAEESDGVIMGLDENNLYGWAMMQKLPYGSMTLHTDRVYCANLLGVLKNVSKQQQQLPYNQRYMYGVIHKLGQLQDPYCFTGFVRCSLYYTQEQRELTKNFPPLAEKVQLDESVQVSGYMDYLKTQLKTKHNKITLQTEKFKGKDYVARVWDDTDRDEKVQDEAVRVMRRRRKAEVTLHGYSLKVESVVAECPHEGLMAEAEEEGFSDYRVVNRHFQLNTQASISPSPNMPPKAYETPADLAQAAKDYGGDTRREQMSYITETGSAGQKACLREEGLNTSNINKAFLDAAKDILKNN
ncbi:hypothetical protein PROFUN_16485 [Planoprotostelium fungivorum]|uniref:DNA-directed DNA polymerase n=1 Tax=Planoprotostelium fungivorum TaxID=1890364 RepID=A0A2P6MPU2_9EUKA|nr:hypothetical protein PROFUN_16485 [Planoprotostelium fungivorum]